MGRIAKWLMVFQVTNTIITNVLIALDDDKVTTGEVMSIIQSALTSLKITGLVPDDINGINLITTSQEWDMTTFSEGDCALVLPKSLLEKLKLDLTS